MACPRRGHKRSVSESNRAGRSVVLQLHLQGSRRTTQSPICLRTTIVIPRDPLCGRQLCERAGGLLSQIVSTRFQRAPDSRVGPRLGSRRKPHPRVLRFDPSRVPTLRRIGAQLSKLQSLQHGFLVSLKINCAQKLSLPRSKQRFVPSIFHAAPRPRVDSLTNAAGALVDEMPHGDPELAARRNVGSAYALGVETASEYVGRTRGS
jgi:hypothetical protein